MRASIANKSFNFLDFSFVNEWIWRNINNKVKTGDLCWISLYGNAVWGLWFHKNQVVFNSKKVDPMSIASLLGKLNSFPNKVLKLEAWRAYMYSFPVRFGCLEIGCSFCFYSTPLCWGPEVGRISLLKATQLSLKYFTLALLVFILFIMWLMIIEIDCLGIGRLEIMFLMCGRYIGQMSSFFILGVHFCKIPPGDCTAILLRDDLGSSSV